MTEYLQKLYDEIKHGDKEHQQWLFDKMEEYYSRTTVEEKIETYEFKDKSYKILHEGAMKIEGVWIPCVVYQSLYENPYGEIWVRSKEAFFERFKLKDEQTNN
jgi:hypothetical protein